MISNELNNDIDPYLFNSLKLINITSCLRVEYDVYTGGNRLNRWAMKWCTIID